MAETITPDEVSAAAGRLLEQHDETARAGLACNCVHECARDPAGRFGC